jgi:hypothetical protein
VPFKDPEKAKASGRRSYLKHREAILARRKLNPYTSAQNHARHIKLRYGITSADYERMLQEQHGLCKLCGQDSGYKSKKKRLFVDHCHTTGKVRGLLCNRCNIGLAMIDQSDWLRKATEYLEPTT